MVHSVAPLSSLRVRLLGLVLVAVLPAAGILYWADRSQRASLVSAVQARAHDLARLVAEQHENAVARARGLLVALARHPSLRRLDGAACSADLAAVLADDALYSNVGGVDRSGNLFCSAVPLRAPVNLADRAHVRIPLARGEFAVGGHVRARSTPGRDIFPFGSPVRDDRGEVVAVAIASFDLAELQRDLETLPLPGDAEVVVVDANGTVLTGRPAPRGKVGTRLTAPLLGPVLAHSDPIQLTGADGVSRIYAFHDVMEGGKVAMRIAAGLPASTAYAPLRRVTRGSVVALMAVAIFALILAAVTGELFIVRKLEAVAAAARRLAAGDAGARTGVAPGPGELGLLVESFDEMAASIERLTRQQRLILEAVGEGIVGIGEDGAITFVNPAAARALGWTAEEMLGHDAHTLFHAPPGSPIAAHHCRIRAVMTERVAQRGGEVFWRRDCTSFAVDFVATPLVDAGRVVGSVLVFKDVSERRKLEERLRHAQKMEAVGQLAGGVAHDFNNLLTAIVSYATLLREALGPAHPSVADVREIEAAARRAAALTRQLLAFSRRQRVTPQVVELRALVAGMERILRRVLPENVRLEAIAEAPGTVFADPAQLEVVILNLAVNARDALPDGGGIVIRVSEVEEDAHDAREDAQLPPGPLAVLEVRDDGVGMDEATRARIFEPFFTTKPPGKGTGLGLATVYGIVSQARGEIRVRSEPRAGSEFRVYLPRSGPAPSSEAAVVPLPRPVRGHETVVVVEDDAAIRSLVQRALSSAGYRVIAAESADDALASVASAPDLLLTDVILPGRNGWELASELQGRFGHLRVLFTSGYSAQPSGEPLVPDDADFLAKPFAPDELLHRVRAILDAPARELVAAPRRSA